MNERDPMLVAKIAYAKRQLEEALSEAEAAGLTAVWKFEEAEKKLSYDMLAGINMSLLIVPPSRLPELKISVTRTYS